jgi:hypothetical protein
LLEFSRVGQDRPQAVGQRGGQLYVLADGPAQEFRHTGDDLIEVEGQRPDCLPACEGEQLPGEGGCPVDCLLDLCHVGAGFVPLPVTAGFGGHGEPVGNERGVTENDRQEVVEIVRHAASELA